MEDADGGAINTAVLSIADGSFLNRFAPLISLATRLDMEKVKLAVLASCDRRVARIRKDKRGGSVAGRMKRLDRLPCQWGQQYFGSPGRPPVYSGRHFRDVFGIPIGLFENILARVGPQLQAGPAADGRPAHSAEVTLLATLRILRTGAAVKQFDDQTGMATSTLVSKFRCEITLP